jgi:hypothetical protein
MEAGMAQMTEPVELIPVAVQSMVEGGLAVTFSSDDRRALSAFRKNFLMINWLPAIIRQDDISMARANEFSLLMFFVGSPLVFAVGAFFGSFFKEAGSDAYKALKEFIVRTVALQTTKTYSADIEVAVVFELEDDFCLIRLGYRDRDFVIDGSRAIRDISYFEEVEKRVQDQLSAQIADLNSHWGIIEKDIKRFNIGQAESSELYGKGQSQKNMHLVSKRVKGWTIEPLPSDGYIGRLLQGKDDLF